MMVTDKLRIIAIDDDQQWRKTITTMMGVLGYTADHTENVDELVKMVAKAERDGNPYHVVTLDMNFKTGDTGIEFKEGLQILRRLKVEFPKLPVMMISGAGIRGDEVLVLRDDYGLDFFIPKDRLDIDSFQAALRRVLSRQPFGGMSNNVAVAASNAQPKPRVFVSYKRQNTWGKARAITNSLRLKNIEVFLDVDSIDQGRFERYILQAIADCQYFLLMLAPGTFGSKWVIEEVKFALKMGKVIIPVLLDDFQFDDTVPPEISEVSAYNAVVIRNDFYDAAIDRLVERFMSD